MTKQTKVIIAGLVSILVSWFFATKVPNSPVEVWYFMMSFTFGFGGVFAILISATELDK